MGFALSTVAAVLVMLLILVLLERRYGANRASGSPGRIGSAPAGPVEVGSLEKSRPDLVEDDVRQMREAHTALRRRRGAPEMSVEELQRAVAEDEANRTKGRGPFGSQ